MHIEMKLIRPPAVIRLTSQSSTLLDEFETDKNERSGKNMVTPKQKIGTPFLVHFLKIFGARPSIASEYKLRLTQYV
jgi:hypothetical protein